MSSPSFAQQHARLVNELALVLAGEPVCRAGLRDRSRRTPPAARTVAAAPPAGAARRRRCCRRRRRTRVAGRGRAAPPRSPRPASPRWRVAARGVQVETGGREPGGRAAPSRARISASRTYFCFVLPPRMYSRSNGVSFASSGSGAIACGRAGQRARVVDEGETGAAVVAHDAVVGPERRRDPVAGQVGLLGQEAVLLQAEQVEPAARRAARRSADQRGQPQARASSCGSRRRSSRGSLFGNVPGARASERRLSSRWADVGDIT